jgi:hypothetical protein
VQKNTKALYFCIGNSQLKTICNISKEGDMTYIRGEEVSNKKILKNSQNNNQNY